MRWIRLYGEVRTDNKMRQLTDKQFRIWLHLLLYAAEQERRGVVELGRLLSLELGCSETALEDTLAKLVDLDIIKRENNTIIFINFDKRQYTHPSDLPERVAERVKRHRNELKRAETGETAPDTEQIQKQNQIQKELGAEESKVLTRLQRYSGWNADSSAGKQLPILFADFPDVDLVGEAASWAMWAESAPKPPKNCFSSFRNWLKNAKPVVRESVDEQFARDLELM